METQVLQHNSEPGVDLIAQPQRAIIAAQSKPVKKGPRTQRQYLLPRPSKEVENIWILIGPRRRDRWMHVHHPRLVKRRYLLLNLLHPDILFRYLQPSPVVIRVQREIYHIFWSFPQATREHIPISARVDASRKQNKRDLK